MLRDGRYESLFPSINLLLAQSVPTHFVMALLSLVYAPASAAIRAGYFMPPQPPLTFSFSLVERMTFSDTTLPQVVRDRVNAWVEDAVAVVTHEPSQLVTARLFQDIHSSNPALKESLFDASREVFMFFFDSVGIDITSEQADVYSRYVMDYMLTRAREWLQTNGDMEFIREGGPVDVM